MKTENNILNELQHLAPTLSKLSRAEGYTVPEGYWQRLHEDILTEIEIEEIELPESAVSGIPEGYFESFNSKVFDKIDAIDTVDAAPEVKVYTLVDKLKPLMGVAASLLLVGMVMYNVFVPRGQSSSATLSDFVSSAEVFDATELAVLDGDIDAILFEEGVVETLALEEESFDEMDDMLEGIFEDEELNELLS